MTVAMEIHYSVVAMAERARVPTVVSEGAGRESEEERWGE